MATSPSRSHMTRFWLKSLVRVLGLAGLRRGELAGLQVDDRVAVPGQGLRLQRAVLASSKRGELFVDTLKGKRARTVPLVRELVPVIDSWEQGKSGGDWLTCGRLGRAAHPRLSRTRVTRSSSMAAASMVLSNTRSAP